MKRTITLFLLAFMFGFSGSVMAQISNTDMEDWSPSGSPAPFDWEFPTGWTTNNGTTEFITAGTAKTTDTYEGNFAAELRTLNVFGDERPSVMVNGTVSLDYDNFTVKMAEAGEPVTTIPSTITGYYKFTAATAGDSAQVAVVLKKYNADLGKADTLFIARKNLPPADVYTSFSVDVDTEITDADSIIVACYSSKPSSPLAGGVLLMDAMQLNFLSVCCDTDLNTVNLYPNPTTGMLRIDQLPETETPGVVQVLDPAGAIVFSENVVLNNTYQTNLTGLENGIYRVVVQTDSYTIQKTVVKM